MDETLHPGFIPLSIPHGRVNLKIPGIEPGNDFFQTVADLKHPQDIALLTQTNMVF